MIQTTFVTFPTFASQSSRFVDVFSRNKTNNKLRTVYKVCHVYGYIEGSRKLGANILCDVAQVIEAYSDDIDAIVTYDKLGRNYSV